MPDERFIGVQGTANRPLQGSSDAVDLCLVREWVAEAGRIALARRQHLDLRLKDDGTPTTSADCEVESFLVDRISERYPHHRILSEEGSVRAGDGDFTWAIDPIDGSRAFASGLPVWGISAGVLWRGRPYAGVFYMPVVGEMYWADGGGGFCNDIPFSRRASGGLEDPLVFLAVPSRAHRLYEIDFRRLRSLGSTAAHLIYVARGAAIGALTRRVKIWDLAGVLPILRQVDVSLVYLSGAPVDVCALLDGQPAPEPMVAARSDVIERVRCSIRVRHPRSTSSAHRRGDRWALDTARPEGGNVLCGSVRRPFLRPAGAGLSAIAPPRDQQEHGGDQAGDVGDQHQN